MTVILTQPPLQPLRGWISKEFVTYNGRKLGPYFVRRWKVGGKLRREYVKFEDLERITAACQANRDKRKRQAETTRKLDNLIGNLNFLEKKANRLDRGIPLTDEDRAFIERIEKEGYEISGRPSLRRPKYARIPLERLLQILSRRFKTDFMVPPFANSRENRKTPVPKDTFWPQADELIRQNL